MCTVGIRRREVASRVTQCMHARHYRYVLDERSSDVRDVSSARSKGRMGNRRSRSALAMFCHGTREEIAKLCLSASEPAIHIEVRNCSLMLGFPRRSNGPVSTKTTVNVLLFLLRWLQDLHRNS